MSNKDFSGRVVINNETPIVEVKLMAIVENKGEESTIYVKRKEREGGEIYTLKYSDIEEYAIEYNEIMEKLPFGIAKSRITIPVKHQGMNLQINVYSNHGYDEDNFELLNECKNPSARRVLVDKNFIDRVTYKINKKTIKMKSNFSSAKLKMYEKCFIVKNVDYKIDHIEVFHKIGEVYFKGIEHSVVNFGLREDFEKDLF